MENSRATTIPAKACTMARPPSLWRCWKTGAVWTVSGAAIASWQACKLCASCRPSHIIVREERKAENGDLSSYVYVHLTCGTNREIAELFGALRCLDPASSSSGGRTDSHAIVDGFPLLSATVPIQSSVMKVFITFEAPAGLLTLK